MRWRCLPWVAYGNSLDNGFVWDDHEQIVMNPSIKAGAPILPLFTGDVRFAHEGPTVQTKAYRPFQMLTYRLVTEWLGGSASAFHVLSVGFAAAGAVAALMMFWLLTGRVGMALAAAALFAVHPVHTEAVDWIAALPDLGVGLMLMLTFVFYLAAKHPATMRHSRWIWQVLALAACLQAMLWKETAVVLPLLIFAYSLLNGDGTAKGAAPRWIRALKQSSPFWLCLAAYLWLRYEALGPLTTGARDWALTGVQYALTVLQLFLDYWIKLLIPVHLNAYTVLRPLQSVMSLAALATMLGAILVLGGGGLSRAACAIGWLRGDLGLRAASPRPEPERARTQRLRRALSLRGICRASACS